MTDWIEYNKDDPKTHPAKEGAYLVTIESTTRASYVEIRPFSFGALFAGDWSRYHVVAWRPVPAAFGTTPTAQQLSFGFTVSPTECATIMKGLVKRRAVLSELIKRAPAQEQASAYQDRLNAVTALGDKIAAYFEALQDACLKEVGGVPDSTLDNAPEEDGQP